MFFIQSTLQFASYSSIHTYTPTHWRQRATMQGAGGLTIGSNLQFSVLSKDTYTCGKEELGIKLPDMWLVDDPL